MSQLITGFDQNIVVVDDSPSFLKVAKSILASLGFARVSIFGDPAAAFEYVTTNHVDLIMTDLSMEPVDGFALADKIRHSPDVINRVVPIMLMTGHAGRQNMLKAIHHGIDDVVIKPLSAGLLHDRLVSVFARPRIYIKTPSGYFGPDRRRRNTPGYSGPERRGGQPADMVGERALKSMRETAYLANLAQMQQMAKRPEGLDASFELTTVSHRNAGSPMQPPPVDQPQPDGGPGATPQVRPPLVGLLRRPRPDRPGLPRPKR
jgi:CheY-like chemotaxis protein